MHRIELHTAILTSTSFFFFNIRTPLSTGLSSGGGEPWPVRELACRLVQQKLGCNFFSSLSLLFPSPPDFLTEGLCCSCSGRKRGLTLMHATPVAASQVEGEASPLLTCVQLSPVYRQSYSLLNFGVALI